MRERDGDGDGNGDGERKREGDRMRTPFIIPPSQATQAHFSMSLDVVPKVVRGARDWREPGPVLMQQRERECGR